jgi:hypothetical protein
MSLTDRRRRVNRAGVTHLARGSLLPSALAPILVPSVENTPSLRRKTTITTSSPVISHSPRGRKFAATPILILNCEACSTPFPLVLPSSVFLANEEQVPPFSMEATASEITVNSQVPRGHSCRRPDTE